MWLKGSNSHPLIEQLALMDTNRPLKLDGKIDLQIKFGEDVMHERVYVKIDLPDLLLLSENE